MSNGLFGIGITGISAAQVGLLVTGNNIANVDTPGYNRQRIGQSNNISIATGSGYIGMGTRVDTVTRIYNQVITDQINQSQTKASELSKYYDQIKQIDNMLADDKAGLSPTLQDLFKGVQTVASNPALTTSRDSLISSAQTFSSRLQNLESRLSSMYAGVNGQLESTVSTINSYAQQIAELNERIIVAQAAVNQPANSLLDQRDQLVAELNKEVAVTTVEESNGAFSVFIGTGQQLVVGTRANSLQVSPSAADPQRMAIGLTTATSSQEMPEYLFTGGNLGGLLSFRSESLDKAANALGQVAVSVALTFNAQHALGQDMLGNINVPADADFNANFFNISDPRVWPNALNKDKTVEMTASYVQPPPLVLNGGAFKMAYDSTSGTYTVSSASGAAPSPWSDTNLNNLMQQVYDDTGTTLDMSSGHYATNITASDYRVSYDGTDYVVTRLSDNKQWKDPSDTALADTVAASEGFKFSLSAAMTQGDSFLVQPTREIARNISVNKAVAADTRLFAAGQPVRTGSATANTGSGVISAGSVVAGYTAPSAGTTGTVKMTFNGGNLDFSVNGAGAAFDVTYTDATGTHTVNGASSIPYTNPSTKYTINGITFEISGNPKDSDTFTLDRNTGGTSDGRNANLLGQLQTQGTVDGGASSYQAAYARLVSNIGNKTREVQVTRDAQQALADQGISAREAQSGVNLDEEAANLLKFQQAYQASAKMMTIASELFSTVLSIGR
jgi:flagellar hook-associated protein 1 FlgK